MLRNCHIKILVGCIAGLVALEGCCSDHVFPRLKPLFAGLDESKVPASGRVALAHAKEDFQLGRDGKAPHYAHYVETIRYTKSKVYQGTGYRLTLVNKDLVQPQEHGPDIVLESSITGGRPYHYDEIDRSLD